MTTFANILALLLAAAALYGMQHSTPSYSEILSPVAVPAAQGKPAQTERFVFGVAKVHLAGQLVAPQFGEPRTYTTSGKWLVVEAAAKAQDRSVSLTSAAWRGPSGLRFAMSTRIGSTLGLLVPSAWSPAFRARCCLCSSFPKTRSRAVHCWSPRPR